MSEERLARIEKTLTEVHTWVRDMRETVKEHDHFIDGNGRPGAKVRLDRIEQADLRRKWLVRAMSLPVIGIILDWIVRNWQ